MQPALQLIYTPMGLFVVVFSEIVLNLVQTFGASY